MKQKPGTPTPLAHGDAARLFELMARNLRHLRSQRGMTRKGLALQSGVSVPHLARLEAGQGNVSVLVLAKLARALNQPVANLFAERDEHGSDLGIIVERLKRQSDATLAHFREQLFSPQEAPGSSKADRIALVGLRGAGKSTVGKQLASLLDRPFIELNGEVEREAGISLPEVINVFGQTGYRNLERRCLERVLATHFRVVVATGGGIVTEPHTYDLLLASFFTIWLHAEREVYFDRVMKQHDARIANPSLYREAIEHIGRTLEARDRLYRMTDIDLDTTHLSVDEVVATLANSRGLAPGSVDD